MALPSFIFGQGTPYKTPEQLEQARRRVQQLMNTGPEQYSRPGGWLYALGDAIGAAQERNRISQSEQYADQQRQQGNNIFSQLMSGAGNASAYPSSVAAGGSPTGAAATNTPVSVPSAPEIRQGLLARGLPEHVADAFLVNFKDESGLNPGINEKNPVVPGSRGGFGLAQWTGPRRRGLEQFASQRGVDPSNTDAQLDYLMTELQGPEAKAAKSIFSAPDTASAAQAIVKNFLRPAPEHQQSRASRYARISDPAMDALVIDNPNAKPLSEAERNELRRRDEALFPFIMGRAGGNNGVQVASLDPSIGMDQQGGATIRAGDYGPSSSAGNAPAGGARATFGGPQLTYDDRGLRFVDEGAQRVAEQSSPPSVAPYDFTGNPQLSAASGLQFQGGQPQQMAALSPGQITTGPDGRTYQNVEQIGGGYGLSPVNLNSGPSAELLRQNDMAFGGALAPQGQDPQQVADASGYFPPAPSMDRAPVQPQTTPQNNNRLQMLSEVLSNPFVPDEQKRVAQYMFQQEMAARDPANMLDMEYKRAQLEALRAKPQTKYGFTTLPDGTVLRTNEATGQLEPAYQSGPKPTSDMQEYEFARSQGYQGSFADYQQAMKKAGASSTNVSVGDGEGKKFYEKLDEEGAKMFGTLLNDGTAARSTLMRVDRLDQLLQTVPTGAVANFQKLAGDWGVNTEGLDNIQAAQALINQIVPQQRPAGSGPMSDADLALFKQSVPRIINAPGGNKIIIDTMRGIAQYTAAQGDIAAKVANREISPAEGRRLLADLPNPLAAIGRRRISSPAEMEALPSGTEFIAPDGSVRRKP